MNEVRLSTLPHTDDAFLGLFREIIDPYVVARLTVEGEPASKARARFTGYRSTTKAYTPAATKAAEEKLAWLFRRAVPGWQVDADSHFGVLALFFARSRQRRDVDNMLKLVLDAFNKIVWKDDVQVAEVSARVTRGCDEARTEILIYRVWRVNPTPTRPCEHCGTHFPTYESWSKRKFCSQACDRAQRAARRRRKCEGCGAAFDSRHGARFCSIPCRANGMRVELTCDRCQTAFTKPKSLMRSGRPFCSPECQQAYWRNHRTVAAKGTCGACGGPTSKKSYARCRACVAAGVPYRPPIEAVTDNG